MTGPGSIAAPKGEVVAVRRQVWVGLAVCVATSVLTGCGDRDAQSSVGPVGSVKPSSAASPVKSRLSFADLEVGRVVEGDEVEQAMQAAMDREGTFRTEVVKVFKTIGGTESVDARCTPTPAWKTSSQPSGSPVSIFVDGRGYEYDGTRWAAAAPNSPLASMEVTPCQAPRASEWPLRVLRHERSSGRLLAVLEPSIGTGAPTGPLAHLPQTRFSVAVDERLRPAYAINVSGIGTPAPVSIKVTYGRYGVPVTVHAPAMETDD